MKCPQCGADASGAYCPACGAPASGARCARCQAPLEPGARYCTQCGTPTRTLVANLPWLVAGTALVALIVVLLLPTLLPPPEPATPTAGAPFLEPVG
ncbi:MAG: zinc ribbon domain-containing protein, partial [Longimicrobiales bacterium]